jgi:hypothetical protein
MFWDSQNIVVYFFFTVAANPLKEDLLRSPPWRGWGWIKKRARIITEQKARLQIRASELLMKYFYELGEAKSAPAEDVLSMHVEKVHFNR